MKIASIVGARPQFIKVKPIVDELKKRKCKHILIHTGQHYDYEMSKVFFDELEIPKPDYNLEVGSHMHGKQTALMLQRIEKVLLKEKPNMVIVYGDTNSTLSGALASVKLNIPVAHVEAGLRSYRLDMPEEINRVLTDHISKFLFCPTKTAVDNLKKEGIKSRVYLVGDVMYDIFKSKTQNFPEKFREFPGLSPRNLSPWNAKHSRDFSPRNFSKLQRAKIPEGKSKILQKLNLKPKEYLLLTIHRQENTDNFENLKSILSALIETEEKIVFPIHPRTKNALKKIKGLNFSNFLFINPISYLDMLTLEKNAKKILTDSGGVQKEAYWFKVPCITLRSETEWVETLQGGCNILTGANREKILKSVKSLNSPNYKTIFKNGDTAKEIVRSILNL